MIRSLHSILYFSLLFLIGCQTTQTKTSSQKESVEQTIAAFGTVTEGLTNQNITKQDLKNLAVQVQSDPKTKSAVQSINEALSVQQKGVKYCPVDGQRFDVSVENCPTHKVKLKSVDE